MNTYVLWKKACILEVGGSKVETTSGFQPFLPPGIEIPPIGIMENEIEKKLKEIEKAFSELEKEMKDLASEPKEEEEKPEVRTLEIGGALFTNLPIVRNNEPEDVGVTIRSVPKEMLGYNVLGRAFPCLKVIEISDDLKGDELEEVKLHEILHVQNPDLNEYNIRERTRSLFRGRTRFD